ncbi:MAG TPA: ATP-binding cassette domain-containing protein, partial [Casimicrobiaceae bacterium]|nr:ATP-binding cassette domain-containing protein [Casimicrobiaceae bacterium]
MSRATLTPPCVEVRDLSKRFGTVQALCDASVRFAPGRVHALLGENGAGKSTLVKCVMGYYRADSGVICVDGVVQPIRSPQDSRALGLGMVYQHFTLVSQMTVAENLVLGRARIPPTIDWTAEHEALSEFMRGMPFRLDPALPVASLSAGEKQKLEILKQ